MRRLLLRPFGDEDVALFEKWLYTPHVTKWYHEPQDWIDEVTKRNDAFSFIHHFMIESGGKPIGFCQYYEYCHSGEDWHGHTDIDGAYSIDYLIGDPEYLGRGFGKEMIQLLIEEIRAQGNAHRIIVQPEKENLASCNALLSCGFTFEPDDALFMMEL